MAKTAIVDFDGVIAKRTVEDTLNRYIPSILKRVPALSSLLENILYAAGDFLHIGSYFAANEVVNGQKVVLNEQVIKALNKARDEGSVGKVIVLTGNWNVKPIERLLRDAGLQFEKVIYEPLTKINKVALQMMDKELKEGNKPIYISDSGASFRYFATIGKAQYFVFWPTAYNLFEAVLMPSSYRINYKGETELYDLLRH